MVYIRSKCGGSQPYLSDRAVTFYGAFSLAMSISSCDNNFLMLIYYYIDSLAVNASCLSLGWFRWNESLLMFGIVRMK